MGCALALLVTSCGGKGDSSTKTSANGAKIAVAAAFYPLQEAAQQIGGDRVQVTNLTPIGGEPHDLRPSAQALQRLAQSKVVLYLGEGFQPAVVKAVDALPAGIQKVDLLQGQELKDAPKGVPGADGASSSTAGADLDPHVWVDPDRFAAMADRIKAALIRADPDGRADYEQRAAQYIAQLRGVESAFSAGLRECQSKVIVTTHAAFGYLAAHHGLRQAAIGGISPDDEPDPRSLAALAAYARQHDVTTVFFETLAPKRLARTLASRIGARIDVLNPIEGLTSDQLAVGDSYVSLQRGNLANLVRGLDCKAGLAGTTPPGTTPAGATPLAASPAATSPNER